MLLEAGAGESEVDDLVAGRSTPLHWAGWRDMGSLIPLSRCIFTPPFSPSRFLIPNPPLLPPNHSM